MWPNFAALKGWARSCATGPTRPGPGITWGLRKRAEPSARRENRALISLSALPLKDGLPEASLCAMISGEGRHRGAQLRPATPSCAQVSRSRSRHVHVHVVPRRDEMSCCAHLHLCPRAHALPAHACPSSHWPRARLTPPSLSLLRAQIVVPCRSSTHWVQAAAERRALYLLL